MRSTSIPLLLAASLVLAAPASAELAHPAAVDAPLPGLSEAADQSLWCATMASRLAQSALIAGDHETFEVLSPLAAQLARQVSTFFVVLHFDEPDIRSYVDLYAAEVDAALAGTAPERFAAEQCQAIAAPDIIA